MSVRSLGQISLTGYTDVTRYGAVGNGTTDDTVAIQSAITAAGVNGLIYLPPGKTFAVSNTLPLLTGQTVWGYGATIKRVNQVITTTTATITSSTTNTFPVAAGDGAKFSVGQRINVYQAGFSTSTGYGSQNLIITSIVGDTITTATSAVLIAGSPWSGTTYVVLSFDTFKAPDGNFVVGLTFDGNYSNWSYYHWENTSEIHLNGTTLTAHTVTDCRFNNCPGEAIQETTITTNLPGNTYIRNYFKNINGNGIHMNGSYGNRIIGNYFLNTNLQGTSMGHNGGAVTFSNNAYDVTVANNYMENVRAGIGQFNSTSLGLTVSGNTIKNPTTYFIEMNGPNLNTGDVTVTGNRFISTSPNASAENYLVSFRDTGSGTMFRATFTGNQFHNAGLSLQKARNVVISGNSFECDLVATDTFHIHINVSNCSNVTIASNTTKYGNAGLNATGTNTNLLISGNSFDRPYYYGVYDSGGSLITGNTLLMDSGANAGSAQGIALVGATTTVKGNSITMSQGYCGIRVNAVANCMVQGNTVRGGGAGKSIRVEASSTGYVVAENQVNAAIVDTPAVGIRVANNDLIT